MRRGVDMRRCVHRRGDALRQHARLGHVMDALDLGVLEIGPVRVLETEAVAQVVELQAHAVVEITLEFDTANFDHQKSSSVRPDAAARNWGMPRGPLDFGPLIDTSEPYCGPEESCQAVRLYRMVVHVDL